MHLDKLSVSHLSLLPLYVRRELLWQLPLADVCQLEDTKFTDGLDMAAYWKYPLDEQGIGIDWWGLPCNKICYYHEWGAAEYERAVLYGLLTAYAFGSDYRPCDVDFRSPLVEDGELDALAFIYAARKPTQYHGGDYDIVFPFRYVPVAITPRRELDVDEVVRCFDRNRDELPKVFMEITLFHNVNLDYVPYLYEAVFVGLQGHPLKEQQWRI